MRRWGDFGSRTALSSKHGNSTESTISKLDSARLKLSKYEQKYGRKGSGKNYTHSLSHSDYGVDATVLFEEPVQHRIEKAIELPVGTGTGTSKRDDAQAKSVDQLSLSEDSDSSELTGSENERLRIENDTLVNFLSITNENKGDATDLNVLSKAADERRETSAGSTAKSLPTQETESSLSEIMENVHSLSSLEIKSEEEIRAEVKQIQLILPENEALQVSVTANDLTQATSTYSMESVQEVSSLTERSEVLSLTFANVLLAEELSNSETKPHIRLQFSPLTSPKPERAATEVSVSVPELVPVPVSLVETDQDSKIDLPVPVLREETTSLFANTQPFAPTSSSILKSSGKSVSPTVVPGNPQKTTLRDAEVQTERKRSRKVQVDLSTRSSADTGIEKRTCPIVRAVSLPKTVLSGHEESSHPLFGGRMSLEDAVHDLMKAQVQLTMGLLRRQHALYLSSCGSTVRLEKGYHRETLSATRQFIRREKRLREALRTSNQKLRSD